MAGSVSWADLMEQIAMTSTPIDVLIIASTVEMITGVIMPDMEQTAPVGTKFWRSQWKITLPNGTMIRLVLLRTPRDLDGLYFTQWDAIVFDPQWQDPGELQTELLSSCVRRRDTIPPLVVE